MNKIYIDEIYMIYLLSLFFCRCYEVKGKKDRKRCYVYRLSTSFSFSLKMFLSSPNVDSIFSRENWFSPSEVLSLATHAFSSVTVLSRRAHSFTRVSTFLTHSSATTFTLEYISFKAATSLSASLCV